MLTRRGVTLVELLVSVTLGALVLATASASVLRQQHTHTRIRSETSADAQLRATTHVLGGELAQLDPTAGDIDSTQARDTAIQFRAAIALSIACGTEAGAATLIPEPIDSIPLGGSVAALHAGDTLWWRADSLWRSAPITQVDAVNATCSAPFASAGATHRLLIATLDTVPAGVPIRVTRQTRISLYRAGDGTWQLGFREWSASGFAAPQPVAGPLVLRAGGRRSGFRYYDAAGGELVPGTAPLDLTRLARIRLVVQTLAVDRDRWRDSIRTDSVDIALRRESP